MKRKNFIFNILKGLPLLLLAACQGEGGLKPRERRIKLVSLETLTQGFTFFEVDRIGIYRSKNELQALLMVCTHQSCLIRPLQQPRENSEFICPCHGSLFARDGSVKRGPAKLPLNWIDIAVQDGEIYVFPDRKKSADWRFSIV